MVSYQPYLFFKVIWALPTGVTANNSYREPYPFYSQTVIKVTLKL